MEEYTCICTMLKWNYNTFIFIYYIILIFLYTIPLICILVSLISTNVCIKFIGIENIVLSSLSLYNSSNVGHLITVECNDFAVKMISNK